MIAVRVTPGISPEHHAAAFERYKQVPANGGIERKATGWGCAGRGNAGPLVLRRDQRLQSCPLAVW